MDNLFDLAANKNQKEPLSPYDTALSTNPTHIAEFLSTRGQMRLLEGDLHQGLELFDSAIQFDPHNPKLFYTQGISLFEYGREKGREKTLHLAGKKLKAATTLDPTYFEAWQAWGNTLCTLGLTFHAHHYFQEASEKLKRAEQLSHHQPKDALVQLYWKLGIVSSYLAKNSGEALDLHHALEAFQKTASYQQPLSADFWRDFGDANLKFASQINDVRFYIKAISCFKQAVSLEPACGNRWMSLGHSLEKLYQFTHDEGHFSQAHTCYSHAAQLLPNDPNVWLSWAQLLCESTRRNPDTKRLRSCIEKCHRAYMLEPHHPLIQATWAEALSHLGEVSERIELIYDAYNKASHAIEKASDLPAVWFSYGMCLLAMGRYFHEEDYYYQAIEKFQTGLTMDRTSHTNWHAIGNAYATLGQLEYDSESLEKSLRFLQRAIDLNPSTFYIIDYATALAKLGEMNHDQKYLEEAIRQFERALSVQRNALYLHPNWLYHYACTLDALGDFYEEDSYYLQAIDILTHVVMIEPDFSAGHHRLGLAFSHLGELTEEIDLFYRALRHFRLSFRHDEENDVILLDWAITLMNLAQRSYDSLETDQLYQEAEHKLINCARLGNLPCFYHLSCLYSLLGKYDRALYYLKKADDVDALPPIEEILQDEWLEELRSTAEFQEFLSQIEHRPNLQEER